MNGSKPNKAIMSIASEKVKLNTESVLSIGLPQDLNIFQETEQDNNKFRRSLFFETYTPQNRLFLDHNAFELNLGAKYRGSCVDDIGFNYLNWTPSAPFLRVTSRHHGQDLPGSTHSSTEQSVSSAYKLSLKDHLRSLWYIYVSILSPILLLPVILYADEKLQGEARCGYVLVLMTIYWCTQCIPIPVTALLPVFLLPILDIMDSSKTTASYFNESSMLFFGAHLIGIAMEVWSVHKRIALFVLCQMGSEPRWLLLGVALVTWFISMSLSSTASAAMMLNVVQALMGEFRSIDPVTLVVGLQLSSEPMSTTPRRITRVPTGQNLHTTQSEEDYIKCKEIALNFLNALEKALLLTVAYSASIGGFGLLTGTATNMVVHAETEKLFGNKNLQSPIDFTRWLLVGVPLSIFCLIIMWLWMTFFHLKCKGGILCCENGRLARVIEDEYQNMGRVSFAQVSVLLCFISVLALWIMRDSDYLPGWTKLFPGGSVKDSAPAILIGVLLFVLPSTVPNCMRAQSNVRANENPTPLLHWRHVHSMMPWTLYLLLGGGYALGKATEESGMSDWIGERLAAFRHVNPWVMSLLLCYIVSILTEFISKTVTATILMPVLDELAIQMEVSPIFFSLPCTMATAFAFIIPGKTPNSVVMTEGKVTVSDTIKSGLFLKVTFPLVLVLMMYTLGAAIFDLETLPDEFRSSPNNTGRMLARPA